MFTYLYQPFFSFNKCHNYVTTHHIDRFRRPDDHDVAIAYIFIVIHSIDPLIHFLYTLIYT